MATRVRTIHRHLQPQSANHTLQTSQTTSSSDNQLAAVCVGYDKPLEIQEVPNIDLEALGDDEIVVAVYACGVNFSDILGCKGKYQIKRPPPFTPGTEIAGEVIGVGEGVKGFKIGDRVLSTGILCSGFAQQSIGSAQATWKLPDNVSYETAAGFLVSYGTALLALQRTASLKSNGETVFVTGAAGSTGLAAVDLAANVFNATVIGACGGKVKGDFVKKMGAKHAIDYNKENVRECLNEYTDGGGVNVVFDTVGGDLFIKSLKSLAHEGRILTIGYTSGQIPKIPANILLVKSCSAMGVVWGDYSVKDPEVFRDSIEQCLRYLSEGKIKPYVGATYPLSKVNEAFAHVTDRKTFGKVVVLPNK